MGKGPHIGTKRQRIRYSHAEMEEMVGRAITDTAKRIGPIQQKRGLVRGLVLGLISGAAMGVLATLAVLWI